MTPVLIITLIAVGFILILLEVLVVPGFVVGIIGVLALGTGVALTYNTYGSTFGTYTAIAAVLFVILGFYGAFKFNIWKRYSLDETISGKANISSSDGVQIGDQGRAISALRPTGTALIENKRYEVTTMGAPIKAQTVIEIIKLNQNKIYVKEIS